MLQERAQQLMWARLDAGEGVTGIAYTAHIAGFAFGLAAAFGGAALMRARGERSDDAPLGTAAGDESAQIDARYQRCMDAITNGDPGTLRANASRVVIDLAKRDSHARVLELYRAIAESSPSTPFTDRALVDAATAADRMKDAGMYVAIAGNLIKQHPGSRLIPQVMWRVAELQRDGGRADLAAKTLEQLAERHPNDPHGVRATEALAGR